MSAGGGKSRVARLGIQTRRFTSCSRYRLLLCSHCGEVVSTVSIEAAGNAEQQTSQADHFGGFLHLSSFACMRRPVGPTRSSPATSSKGPFYNPIYHRARYTSKTSYRQSGTRGRHICTATH